MKAAKKRPAKKKAARKKAARKKAARKKKFTFQEGFCIFWFPVQLFWIWFFYPMDNGKLMILF